MQILTDQEILEDIQEFEKRISAAREKIDNLPEGRLPFGEHKKRELQRRLLTEDIKHVFRLIEIAEEALLQQSIN